MIKVDIIATIVLEVDRPTVAYSVEGLCGILGVDGCKSILHMAFWNARPED